MLRVWLMRLASTGASKGVGQFAQKAAAPRPMLVRSLGTVSRTVWPQLAPALSRQGFRSASSAASPASRMATLAYQYEAAPGGVQSASIEEVEFSPILANSLSLMGTVGKKPELRFFENGNKVATWSIAFSDKKGGETQWFNVEAWGPLADVAAAEIDRGQRIVVEGRLRVESWTTRENEQRKTLKIVANALKRVRSNFTNMGQTDSRMGNQNWQQPQAQQQQDYQQPQQQQQWGSAPAAPAAAAAPYTPPTPAASSGSGMPVTTEELWMSYFEDPSGWYDNRPAKLNATINAKSPDFKKREGGREAPALWIDSRTTPTWVQQELQRQSEGVNGGGQQAFPPF